MNKIIVRDMRGENMVAVGIKNKETVKRWFAANKNGTQADCCREAGLSDRTVRKHLRTILKEQKG